MDVSKTIAELTSQLSEVNYESEEEDNILLKDSFTKPEPLEQNDVIDYELGQSLLRNRNNILTLPEKTYGGKKTSRKKTFSFSETSDNEFLEDSENSEIDKTRFGHDESDVVNDDQVDEESDGDEEGSEESKSSEGGIKTGPSGLSQLENLKQGSDGEKSTHYKIYSEGSKNVTSDVKKGTAIKNQLKIWESLLECRIKLQKGLSVSNNLPTTKTFMDIKSAMDPESLQIFVKCRRNLLLLLKKMNELQEELLKQSDELKATKDKKPLNMNDEILSDESEIDDSEEDEDTLEQPLKKRIKINDFAEMIQENHAKLIPFRNASIQKWNDKTKVSAGKMANSNFSAFDHSTLKQIEQILVDKPRLINRTRVRRNDTHAKIAVNQEELVKDVTLDPEIFDDTDFYHKLLRDYIERKTSDATNSSNTEKQMVELQKLRSKMKRAVDTKCSKGRKLRYVVLPKLVNFMAPNPLSKWSEEAETELYNSLFG